MSHRHEHAVLSETIEGCPASVEVYETPSLSAREIPLARATGTGERLEKYLEYERSFIPAGPEFNQLVAQSFGLSDRVLRLTCYLTQAQFGGTYQLAQRYFPLHSIELRVVSRLQFRSLAGDAPLLTEFEFFRGGSEAVSISTHLG